MPLASLGGWPPPLRPRPRRWRGVARPAPGAGHSSPRRHACGVHGWAPGGTRSLTLARLRLAQGARREDRRGSPRFQRGSSRRSAALSWPPAAAPPCGLRVGARAWMRYAAARREPNPASDPRSSRRATRSGFAYARRSNPPKRRISNAACPSAPFQAIFRLFRALRGLKMAPRALISPKNGLKKRCKAACNSPRAFLLRKNHGATCFLGGLPASRGLLTAPGTAPTAQARSGLGSGLRPSKVWSLNPRTFIKSPRSKSSLHPQRPCFA